MQRRQKPRTSDWRTLIQGKRTRQGKKVMHRSKQQIILVQLRHTPKPLNARQMIQEDMLTVLPHTSNSPPSPTQSRSPPPTHPPFPYPSLCNVVIDIV